MTFIATLAPFAIKHGIKNNVLPSLILAQGIVESASGKSELALGANNLFGIKVGSGWTGLFYTKITKEHYPDGKEYFITADFRKYDTYEGCVIDLCTKYTVGTGWEDHNRYAAVVGERDYKAATQALKDAGYASDINYPTKLNKAITDYNLTQYDKEVHEMVIVKQQLVSKAANLNAVTLGSANKKTYITIHETANESKGANAQAHANLQSNGNSRQASWHYTVDDKEAIQSFDHKYSCMHAGDGKGEGNMNSIGIEICVNSDGDFKKAFDNAIDLVRIIMKKENIPIQNVVQHNHWSGKQCPAIIRKGSPSWADFIQGLRDNPISKPETPKEVDALYKPSKDMANSTLVVLKRLEQKAENPLSPQWADKMRAGTLTESEAIGIIFTAIERGHIVGK